MENYKFYRQIYEEQSDKTRSMQIASDIKEKEQIPTNILQQT